MKSWKHREQGGTKFTIFGFSKCSLKLISLPKKGRFASGKNH